MPACTINPVTGERELTLVSESQAIAMGKQSAAQVAATVGLVDDKALQSYVGRVGHTLAADTARPDLPWQFKVVDDPSPNAFALPGGFIFITRGLIDLMTSEAQLAAVLGHEIGHVTARHAVVQLSRQKLAQIGLGLGVILSPEIAQYGQLASQGLNLLFLKYSRDDERQADKLGFMYMVNEGYDPNQMVQVFQALQESTQLAGASPLPGWLPSHPSDPERIAKARARIAALPKAERNGVVGRDDYLPHVDGLAYGKDPRNGFFRGDWFYHPTLAFRFYVPSTWHRQNLDQAVEALSPKKDAALRLTISQAASPADAARAFLAQREVAGVDSRRVSLGGNPAVVVAFQAAAQGGRVGGYTAFVAHGGTTFELMAYAPARSFAEHRQLLEHIATSFATVRDRDILNVQPERIAIVKLPAAMTLGEFNRRYPSAIGLDELALINQIDDRQAKIPAGTLLKRVTGKPVEQAGT